MMSDADSDGRPPLALACSPTAPRLGWASPRVQDEPPVCGEGLWRREGGSVTSKDRDGREGANDDDAKKQQRAVCGQRVGAYATQT